MEEIASWIGDVAEDRIVPELREKLDTGAWTFDSVAAGLVLLGARRIDSRFGGGGFHAVLQVRALRAFSMGAPAAESLVPIVYGMLLTRGAIQAEPFALPSIDESRVPDGAGASERLIAAVEADDLESALLEVTALARSGPRWQLEDTLLTLGSRRARGLGHEAIGAAKGLDLLRSIPGAWSEDLLRSMVYADMTKEALNGPEHDDVWRASRERTMAVRCDWESGAEDGGAVRSLALELGPIVDPLDSVAVIERYLDDGISPKSIWDGLVIAAAAATYGPANYHATTAVSALRDAYLLASTARVRLLMLLQGAAFLTLMDQTEGLADVSLLDLVPAPATLDEVFETGDRAGVERALGYLRSGGDATAYAARVAEMARARAFDEHHYKIPDAAFLEAARVSQDWRSHVLAICRIYAPSTATETNLAWQLVMGA